MQVKIIMKLHEIPTTILELWMLRTIASRPFLEVQSWL
jgi:hypothetical protein